APGRARRGDPWGSGPRRPLAGGLPHISRIGCRGAHWRVGGGARQGPATVGLGLRTVCAHGRARIGAHRGPVVADGRGAAGGHPRRWPPICGGDLVLAAATATAPEPVARLLGESVWRVRRLRRHDPTLSCRGRARGSTRAVGGI